MRAYEECQDPNGNCTGRTPSGSTPLYEQLVMSVKQTGYPGFSPMAIQKRLASIKALKALFCPIVFSTALKGQA